MPADLQEALHRLQCNKYSGIGDAVGALRENMDDYVQKELMAFGILHGTHRHDQKMLEELLENSTYLKKPLPPLSGTFTPPERRFTKNYVSKVFVVVPDDFVPIDSSWNQIGLAVKDDVVSYTVNGHLKAKGIYRSLESLAQFGEASLLLYKSLVFAIQRRNFRFYKNYSLLCYVNKCGSGNSDKFLIAGIQLVAH